MRRAATVLLTAALTAGGLAALAPPASAGDIVARDLTITVTGIGPENRTCHIDADLYVHRFAAGHRLVVVLAGGDMAYRGSSTTQPVTLTTGPGHTQQLTIPVTN